MREGGCSCGEIRYRLTSDPLFTHCCHCLNCQRQTGSAFVINVLIETDRVELLAGEPQPVDVPRGGGKKQRIFRCPTCQVAVFSRYTRASIRFVRAGTLDDPSTIDTRYTIGVENIMVECDFPHGDGTWPDTQLVIEKAWGHIPKRELRMMCSENAAALYRHPLPDVVLPLDD